MLDFTHFFSLRGTDRPEDIMIFGKKCVRNLTDAPLFCCFEASNTAEIIDLSNNTRYCIGSLKTTKHWVISQIPRTEFFRKS